MADLDVPIEAVIPEGAAFWPEGRLLPQSWFNLVPYQEMGLM